MRPHPCCSRLRTARLSRALGLAVVLTAGASAQAPVNANGGFESTGLGVVTDLADGVEGWDLEVGGGAAATFAVVGDVAHTGDRALRVSVEAAGRNVYDVQAIATPLPVTPGATYRVSAWMRTDAGEGTASVTVGNAAFMEYGRLGEQPLTAAWQEFAFDFVVTDQETVIRAPLHVSFSANVGGAVYIDDVRIFQPTPTGLPERPLAAGASKFLGNLYSDEQRPNFEFYWTQVTPENAGKWGSVEATRDVMTWGDLDAAYALARDNGLPFRFHVLVWGNQQPTWIAALPPDEQLEEIEEWFQAVAERYPDIDYVEVVNEPLHDPPTVQPGDPASGGYIEALGGSGATGWDWVVTAFELAREAFPNTPLVINDYNILSSTAQADRYLVIVDLLRDRGLIDKIGVQGHAFSTRPGAPIRAVLDRLATTGLPIQVTELDVDGNPSANPALSDAASDANQLRDFQRIFPVLWEHPAVEGITLWGWRVGHWRTAQDAFLVRADGSERPALEWLRGYLDANPDPNPTAAEPDAEAGGARLLANRPNPFRTSTEIRFVLAEPGDATVTVFDALGRTVARPASGARSAGEHGVRFDAAGLPSGVYLVRLDTGARSDTRSLVVLG